MFGNTPGVLIVAEHQPIGFLPLEVARQQPASTAGDVDHVGAPLIEDQVEAGTQPIPALLKRALRLLISRAMVAGRKCVLQLVDP